MRITLSALLFFCSLVLFAQNEYCSDSQKQKTEDNNTLSARQTCRFYNRSVSRIRKLTKRIQSCNDIYLLNFSRCEDLILHGVCSFDSIAAEALIQDAWYSFNRFENIVGRESLLEPGGTFNELDSLTNAIEALDSAENCLCEYKQAFWTEYSILQKELKRNELISAYIHERTAFINTYLGGYGGLNKNIGLMNNNLGYFNAQVIEYKSLFGDKSRIENIVLSYIHSAPEFSQIAAAPSPTVNLSNTLPSIDAGNQIQNPLILLRALLGDSQTEKKTQSILQGADPIRNQVSAVSTELSELIGQADQPGDSIRSPVSVKSIDNSVGKKEKSPESLNKLKTKRFVDRINFGSNFQASRRNAFFPISGVIAGQLAYQFSPRIQLGLGCSWIVGFNQTTKYEMGEFPVFSSLASNGTGLRTFCNYGFTSRISGSFNYELNNRQTVIYSEFQNSPFVSMKWNTSLLAGLKFSLSSKSKSVPIFELLYDINHHRTGQPALVFRTGFQFYSKHSIRN